MLVSIGAEKVTKKKFDAGLLGKKMSSYRKIEQDKTKSKKKTELSVAEAKGNQLTNMRIAVCKTFVR